MALKWVLETMLGLGGTMTMRLLSDMSHLCWQSPPAPSLDPPLGPSLSTTGDAWLILPDVVLATRRRLLWLGDSVMEELSPTVS